MYLNKKLDALKLSRVFYWLAIAALMVYFLNEFKSFLQPFILALLSWFLIKDLSGAIARITIVGKSLPRWVSRIIAFGIILGILIAAVEIVSNNIEIITASLPEYGEKYNLLVSQLGETVGVQDIVERIQMRLSQLDFQSFISDLLGSLTSFAGNIFIILIYVAFLLIEEAVFSKKMKIVFKDANRLDEIKGLAQRMTSSVHAYLSVKTIVSLLTGGLSYIVLLLLNVDLPELWAFLIFVLNFVPYLGSFVSTLLPSVFAVFQFNSLIYFVWVYAAIQTVQILVANVVEPKIMGKQLNLSPLVVILSLSFWGMIWGILGMVIAIPITSIVMIILAQLESTRNLALLLSESGDIQKVG